MQEKSGSEGDVGKGGAEPSRMKVWFSPGPFLEVLWETIRLLLGGQGNLYIHVLDPCRNLLQD